MIPFIVGFPSFLNAYIRSRNNRSLGTTDRLQKFHSLLSRSPIQVYNRLNSALLLWT